MACPHGLRIVNFFTGAPQEPTLLFLRFLALPSRKTRAMSSASFTNAPCPSPSLQSSPKKMTMFRKLALALLCSSAVAFHAPAPVSRSSVRLQAENKPAAPPAAAPAAAAPAAAAAAPPPPAKPQPVFSKSVPFLLKPKNLDGMVGDVGFDPLGLAEYVDIRWLREAELKNGACGRSWAGYDAFFHGSRGDRGGPTRSRRAFFIECQTRSA